MQASNPFVMAQPVMGNYALMLLIACVFYIQMLFDPDAEYLSGMVLEEWSASGLFGHMWLHMTPVHLVGNLVTLWVFGYHVCPTLGNRAYAVGYVAAGAIAGLVHMTCDGRPVIGASGAIMGVLGMHVVTCFGRLGRFAPWLIFIWFMATVGAGMVGSFPAAYMAHVGGFLSGMVLSVCFIIFRIGNSDGTDPALLAILRRSSG